MARDVSSRLYHAHDHMMGRARSHSALLCTSMKRQAHFNLFVNLFVANHGYHEASWKVSPNGAKGAIGLDHFIEVDHVMPILQARGVAPREYAPGVRTGHPPGQAGPVPSGQHALARPPLNRASW